MLHVRVVINVDLFSMLPSLKNEKEDQLRYF
jgi:hypothetical protein